MTKQFILVVYDISADKRRTRLHNLLLDYGSPVQYSVFECVLEAEEVKKMKLRIKKITKPKLDNLRYYYLCGACISKIENLQGEVEIKDGETLVV